MILAVRRLQTLGWFALIFTVLIALYPLSLSVATLRSDLKRVERDIARIKADNRYLETEFATRASLAQLNQWNALEYGYVAPSAGQYLDGERALANLDAIDGRLDRPVRVAAMTIAPDPATGSADTGADAGDDDGEADRPAPAPPRALALAEPLPVRAGDAEAKPAPRRRLLDDKLLGRLAMQARAETLSEGGQ